MILFQLSEAKNQGVFSNVKLAERCDRIFFVICSDHDVKIGGPNLADFTRIGEEVIFFLLQAFSHFSSIARLIAVALECTPMVL